jgi:alginate O-acetyltransferase complex protein AlgI
MFPQLVAGPITRYHTISRRLGERWMTPGRASAGIRIFVIGLAQKVLIADEVARLAEAVFDKASLPSLAEAWLGLSAYTIQIYFDFAGYSNMAIGLGLALGFSFPRNFRLPYVARSITEFWRRWHISLSQWLRDYLYIPLGGNRGTSRDLSQSLSCVSRLRTLARRELDFRDLGRASRRLPGNRAGSLGRVLARAPVAVGRVYALGAIMSGWVWFRARDVEHALSYFASLAGLHGASGLNISTHIVLHPATIAALVIGTVLATIESNAWRVLRGVTVRLAQPIYALGDTVAVTAIFVLSILSVAAGSYSPFLYFRF